MSNKSPIRVMLVDDHAVVHSGIAAFLAAFDDLELVGDAYNGVEALHLCDRLHPDVILMDLIMPLMDGATATRAIRTRYPDIQILTLTRSLEEELVQNALQAGAIGYLLKDITAEELAAALRSAYRGQPTLASAVTQALIHATNQNALPTPGANLTEREREVLDLMVNGNDNNSIADHLVVSRSTAKFHVSNILSKLHAANRTQAVAIALQNDLVSSHAPALQAAY